MQFSRRWYIMDSCGKLCRKSLCKRRARGAVPNHITGGDFCHDQDNCQAHEEKDYRMRGVQEHLPVCLQDKLHGGQPVLRAHHKRAESRESGEMTRPAEPSAGKNAIRRAESKGRRGAAPWLGMLFSNTVAGGDIRGRRFFCRMGVPRKRDPALPGRESP